MTEHITSDSTPRWRPIPRLLCLMLGFDLGFVVAAYLAVHTR